MRYVFPLFGLLFGMNSIVVADSDLSLKLVAKSDSITWPVKEKPEEFAAKLKETEKSLAAGMFVKAPPAINVEFVLQFKNNSKETVEIFVNGDPNLLTLNLTGPGVVSLSPPIAMTREFRLPKLVKIEAGKSYEMPVSKLSDGMRGVSRLHYFTAPGEYELKATYQLTDSNGQKSELLQSNSVKFTVKKPD